MKKNKMSKAEILKRREELQVASAILDASGSHILQWASCMRQYGEFEFTFSKDLGKKVVELRKSMWHTGTQEETNNFFNRQKELKNFIHNLSVAYDESLV